NITTPHDIDSTQDSTHPYIAILTTILNICWYTCWFVYIHLKTNISAFYRSVFYHTVMSKVRRFVGDPSLMKKEAERRVAEPETTTSRKRSWDMLDAAIRNSSRTTEWDEFEWSKRVVHVSVTKQTKWWYAKQFLHPDIVARYDYIFIWDEDLGVEHFNAEAYIKLVRKHGLEISQPGLEPDKGLTWQMTKRRGDQEVHKVTEERPGWCSDPHLPPCAAFVEIMATVFSRDAWRCNDLVHGWGLDFALRKCVEIANVREWLLDFFMNEVIDIGGSCRVE
ncbi:hypothetical protein ACJX0J_027259, partial [Zea mays]